MGARDGERREDMDEQGMGKRKPSGSRCVPTMECDYVQSKKKHDAQRLLTRGGNTLKGEIKPFSLSLLPS